MFNVQKSYTYKQLKDTYLYLRMYKIRQYVINGILENIELIFMVQAILSKLIEHVCKITVIFHIKLKLVKFGKMLWT